MTVTELRIQYKMDNGNYPPTHARGSSKHISMYQYALELEERVAELLSDKGVIRPNTISTCSSCPDSSICEFASDGYNTNGDCLAIK